MDHLSCHQVSSAAVTSPLLQIFSLGLIWVFLHCAPMCGPIVSGLNLDRNIHPALAIGLYQIGRGMMYAIFGALAGLLGSSFDQGPVWGWILVGVIATLLMAQLFPSLFKTGSITPRRILDLTRWSHSLKGWVRPFTLGMIFAFLPCMLTAWALGLAASSGSPFQGSLVMLSLVLMTTLPLLTVTWGVSRIFRTRQRTVSSLLLALSLLWTVLVTLADQKYISHQHLILNIHGKDFTLMFW